MGSRQYVQKEWKLLSWWLATYHPHAAIAMNVRVGPTAPVAQLAGVAQPPDGLLRVRNRWVDALFVENGELYVVEAKLEPDPGIFSQLIHYARKIRADPNYSEYANTRIRMIALVYHDDPSVAIEAPWYGVQWVVYQPALRELLPPMLRGSPLAAHTAFLPQDWPARVSWITGVPWVLGG
ncbi:MAG: hypothetical protein ACREQ5_13545 [Candidatus Dormibacteria bacterium]